MRRGGLFVALSAGSIAVAGLLLSFAFRQPGDLRAIVVSGCLALAVQLVLFAAVRAADPRRFMTMWGLGALVRLVTLVVYGVVMLRPFHLPPTAALVSLASFLFVTTLIESRLLVS